jgi:lipopolysaccharide transport system permease protein
MTQEAFETPLPPAGLRTGLVSDIVNEYVPTKRRVPLSDVWTTRRVLAVLGVRDIIVKYKQSALGPLWLLIQPLGTLVAVTLAFSAVVGVETPGDAPYVVFALVGLTVWNFVQLAMSASTDALIRNAILVRRSICPRVALLNAQVVSNLPPFLVIFAVTLISVVASIGLGVRALLLPLLIAWLLLFAWGIVLIVGSVSARFRDAVSAIPLIAQAGIFLSPVGYSPAQADGLAEVILLLNPVSGLIEAWRWCLLGGAADDRFVVVALVSTALLAVAGWRLFTRMEVRFADYL